MSDTQTVNAEAQAPTAPTVEQLMQVIGELQRRVHFAEAKIHHIAQSLGMVMDTSAAAAGHRQITSDPRRVETGQGPMLSSNSSFL